MERHNADLNSQVVQLVSFKVRNEEFGLDILQVQEIIRMLEIASLPSSPKYVKGVVDLRNKVIPIIDMRARFQLPPIPYDNDTRIIVVHAENLTVGLVVDAVCEVIRLKETEIERPPTVTETTGSQYIKGVSKMEKGLLIILDIQELIGQEDFLNFVSSNDIAL